MNWGTKWLLNFAMQNGRRWLVLEACTDRFIFWSSLAALGPRTAWQIYNMQKIVFEFDGQMAVANNIAS